MTTRADRRHLDDSIRRAVHGAMAELLQPLMAQPDFQKRLAMAIAARMPEREAKPAPAQEASGKRSLLTTKQKAAIDAAFAKLGDKAAVRRQFPEIRPTTIYSHLARREQAERAATPPQTVVPPAAVAEPEATPPPVVAEPSPSQPASAAAAAVTALVPEPALPPDAPTPAPARVVPSWAAERREVEQTTPKAVRAWLEQRLRDGGQGKIAAEDKVAAMTHDEALQQANIRRAVLKQPLFAFLGAKA